MVLLTKQFLPLPLPEPLPTIQEKGSGCSVLPGGESNERLESFVFALAAFLTIASVCFDLGDESPVTFGVRSWSLVKPRSPEIRARSAAGLFVARSGLDRSCAG